MTYDGVLGASSPEVNLKHIPSQFGHRRFWLSVMALLPVALSNCGPAESGAGTGGASAGGALTGEVSAGGSLVGGTFSVGGTTTGGASSNGGTTTGGAVPTSGGSDPSGGADNSGGTGELPNWESNPPDAEFFRACLDPSGREITLRVKTPDGCVELEHVSKMAKHDDGAGKS